MWTEMPAPTFVAEGTRVQGSMTFLSSATIHGVIEGNLQQQSVDLLQIGRTAWIHGQVSSLGPIYVEGRIEGDIVCRAGVRLSSTAIVAGKITAPSVEVALGAQVNGEFQVSRPRAALAAAT